MAVQQDWIGDACTANDLVRLPRFMKRYIIIISHSIAAAYWDKHHKKLIDWYINDYWAALESGRNTPQFLIFLNIEYQSTGKPGGFQSLFHFKGHRKKAIQKALARYGDNRDDPCPCLFIEKELRGVNRQHVKDWFDDHRIGLNTLERQQVLDNIFGSQETMPMAVVEAALEDLLKEQQRLIRS